MSALTEAENNALARLVDAWNAFVRLPIEHADDVAEFRHGIHALQNQILARSTRRHLCEATQ